LAFRRCARRGVLRHDGSLHVRRRQRQRVELDADDLVVLAPRVSATLDDGAGGLALPAQDLVADLARQQDLLRAGKTFAIALGDLLDVDCTDVVHPGDVEDVLGDAAPVV